jgi:hypothetical protein
MNYYYLNIWNYIMFEYVARTLLKHSILLSYTTDFIVVQTFAIVTIIPFHF